MNAAHKLGLITRKVSPFTGKRVRLRVWNPRSFHQGGPPLLKQEFFHEKSERLKKIKVKQAKMQKDDGLPVFLKRGLSDKILFNVTLGMITASFIWSMSYLYELSKT